MIEAKAKQQLSRMTLEEKIAQVQTAVGDMCGLPKGYSAARNGIPAKVGDWISAGLGNLNNVCEGLSPSDQAESMNALQKHALENSRLGIPLLIHGESLHGWRTIFPQAVALGATWNQELLRRVFSAIALEMRSCGYHVSYSPVLDLATDPRWGRCQECYGEDPYLVSRMGVAAVKGYQGEDPTRMGQDHIVACAKHFAGYGQSEGGRNFAPVHLGKRRLHDEILAPFRAAVTEAGLLAIMPAHHEIDGVPCHANRELLETTLRHAWGFQGFLVCDADDIRRLHTLHGIAEDDLEAAAMGLRNRIAVDILACQSYRRLNEVLERHPELEKELDAIVLDTLMIKDRLGLFENPFVDTDRADRVCRSSAHLDLAREAACQAATLLKNEQDLLPLDVSGIQRLAVIGPNSDSIQCGTYGPSIGISILEGLRSFAENRFEIVHAEGCRITRNQSTEFLLEEREESLGSLEANPELVGDEENAPLIAKAVEAARSADLAILVLGGNNYTGREAFYSSEHRGDLTDLRLPGSQSLLLNKVAETGTPIVLILNHGNAALLDGVLPKVKAALEIWYAGEQTGPAVADILFGAKAPGGKLPVTLPRSTGSVPFVARQKPSGFLKTPLFMEPGPLLPFGYGLSTSRFTMTTPTLSSPTMTKGGTITVSTRVVNEGGRDADQVLQVYLRDHHASVTRPLRTLVDFQRFHLTAGSSREVSFTLTEETLSFTRLDGTHGPEPGRFTLYLGFDSTANTSIDFTYSNL